MILSGVIASAKKIAQIVAPLWGRRPSDMWHWHKDETTATVAALAGQSGTVTVATYPSTGGLCCASILLPDGTVFMAIASTYPSGAINYAKIFNPSTNTITTKSALLAESGGSLPGFWGACLLNDGRVLLTFSELSYEYECVIYDPVSDSLSYVPLPAGESSARRNPRPVLLPNGKVLIPPTEYGKKAAIIDPVKRTCVLSNANFALKSSAFAPPSCGCVLADGRVYMPPEWCEASSAAAYLYDPDTDTATLAGGTWGVSTGSQNAILLPDGRVFCAPVNSSSAARIYDPITNTTISKSGFLDTIWVMSHENYTLLPDGKIFMFGFQSRPHKLYDPVANVITSLSTNATLYSGFQYTFGTLLNDGRVLIVGGLNLNGSGQYAVLAVTFTHINAGNTFNRDLRLGGTFNR